MWPPGQRNAFLTLLDRVCDQRASADDVAAIERIVRDVPEAKSLYVAYLDLHGTLIWDAVEGQGLAGTQTEPAAQPFATTPDKITRRRRRLLATAAAACAALVLGIIVGRMSHGPVKDQPVAANDERSQPDTAHQALVEASPRVRQPVELTPRPEPEVATELVSDHTPSVKAEVAGVVEPPVSATGDDIVSVSARIDALLRQNWQELKLTPSPRADDAEWCRRIYLDVAGRIPTVSEIDTFLSDQQPDKRRRLADALLESADYARNLATIWANLLVGRSPPPEVNRESLQKFLRMSFAANKPWNELVATMLSAEGRVDENGAANFLVAHLNNDAMPATAVTSQLFFGTQLRCAQCHNHPFNDTKQSAFWELNSLFQQTEVVNARPRMSREPRSSAAASLVSRTDGGPIYYETTSGLMKVAFPRFAGHEIDPEPGVNRREMLAKLLVSEDQPQMAAAFVNRVWAHFFGAGFTRPIDDFGVHNPPSQPELFTLLRDEFIRSGYDIKQLTRWITSSEAYQLSSRPQPGNLNDDPTHSDAPAFSRVYAKPMSPEQLFDSLVIATQAPQGATSDWTAAEARRQEWLDDFIVSLNNDENEEEETLTGTYAQAFALMNGELIQEALNLEPGTFLGDLVRARMPEAEKIRRLCLAALSRPPTAKELPAMQRVLHDAGLPRRPNTTKSVATPGGYQDLFWALLNSNEFSTVH